MDQIISFEDYALWSKTITEDPIEGTYDVYPPVNLHITEPEAVKFFDAKDIPVTCRNCHSILTSEILKDLYEYKHDPQYFVVDIQKEMILKCYNCGWWLIVQNISNREGHDYLVEKRNFIEAIVKKYNIDSLAVPEILLKQHLRKNQKDIYKIHSRKFETLVVDVYKDFFTCEVKHIGGPGDNGIDAYAIIGDIPHIIQCKRRTSTDAVESVSTVREFIGTLVSSNVKKGHIITTAPKFSPNAVELTHNPYLVRMGIEISLKNIEDIYQMLSITQSPEATFPDYMLGNMTFQESTPIRVKGYWDGGSHYNWHDIETNNVPW
ncbi:MAG: restriction endonuclease [Marinoscillum sp.]